MFIGVAKPIISTRLSASLSTKNSQRHYFLMLQGNEVTIHFEN